MSEKNFHINKPTPGLQGLGSESLPVDQVDPEVPHSRFPSGPPAGGRATADQPGVFGASFTKEQPGVEAFNGDGGIGVLTEGDVGIHARGSRLAGLFEGDVEITGRLKGSVNVEGDLLCTGDIQLVNEDCAEEFDIIEGLSIEPGTVMVLSDDGALCPSHSPYDKRVAGVVSGAGDYRPALRLGTAKSSRHRLPIALMGKVYCRVDATESPIEVGDLLTSSATEGRAMKAGDPNRAFGTVIGKALKPLKSGLGLIPILVALQ